MSNNQGTRNVSRTRLSVCNFSTLRLVVPAICRESEERMDISRVLNFRRLSFISSNFSASLSISILLSYLDAFPSLSFHHEAAPRSFPFPSVQPWRKTSPLPHSLIRPLSCTPVCLSLRSAYACSESLRARGLKAMTRLSNAIYMWQTSTLHLPTLHYHMFGAHSRLPRSMSTATR